MLGKDGGHDRLGKTVNPPFALSAVLLISGAALTLPGTYLVLLGGSSYYVLAGLLSIVSAILLGRKHASGVHVFAVVLTGTVVWAVWEAGLNGWALMPRVLGPIALGLWLSLPSPRRNLLGKSTRWFPPLVGALVMSLSLASAIDVYLNSARHAPSASGAFLGGMAVPEKNKGEWLEYGGDKGGSRFSTLSQITPSNITKLERAWIFHPSVHAGLLTTFEATPIKVHDRLYFCTGDNQVFALDAETGKEVWHYDPHTNSAGVFEGTCRGVSYYRNPTGGEVCPERILTATIDARLIAIDLRDGRPCADFGQNGIVDLTIGMGKFELGYYHVTSAPQIVRGKVVLGGWVTDGQYVGEPPGVIRAFDAVTGKFAWAWDAGRPEKHDQPSTGETYTLATPNSWGPISADEESGLVYIPTGTATPDYYGGYRTAADDQYSSSVIALDADTGQQRWSFQTTHHDLWDYDVASQPTLIDLPDGQHGLLQATKRGETFLLDRLSGKPIAEVAERPVPQGVAKGDRLSETQPFSIGLPSLAGPIPSETQMWGLTPFDQLWCRIKFRQAYFDGSMTPLRVNRPTIVYPGYIGGSDWGGLSVDKDRGLVIANTNRLWNYDQLLTRADADRQGLKPFSAASHGDVGGPAAQIGTPYAASVRPFLSPLKVPCNQPPWGMISAIDLRTRKLVWSEPLGTGEDSGPFNIPTHIPLTMGVPNLGGSVVTRGGVLFIAATLDRHIRAFETATGRELWEDRLPNGGQATPMVYWSDKSKREFVVIAAGGHPAMLTEPGNYMVAYALPPGEQ